MSGAVDEGIKELTEGTENASPNLYALFLLARAQFKVFFQVFFWRGGGNHFFISKNEEVTDNSSFKVQL